MARELSAPLAQGVDCMNWLLTKIRVRIVIWQSWIVIWRVRLGVWWRYRDSFEVWVGKRWVNAYANDSVWERFWWLFVSRILDKKTKKEV